MNIKKKNIIIILLIIIVLIIGGVIYNKNKSSKQVIINNIKILVEIADTAKSRQLGLSYRKSLNKNSGMLFVMDKKALTGFWMKDMQFSLDMIWIDGDKIVKISKNLLPAGSHPDISYNSGEPIDYVLEVNGGFCDKKGIKVGDKIIFDL